MAAKKPTREEARRLTEEKMKNGLDSDPMLPLPGKKTPPPAKKKAPAKGKK